MFVQKCDRQTHYLNFAAFHGREIKRFGNRGDSKEGAKTKANHSVKDFSQIISTTLLDIWATAGPNKARITITAFTTKVWINAYSRRLYPFS